MKTNHIQEKSNSINIWLTRKKAAAKISVSEHTVDRRAIPWQEESVPFRLRYKILDLGSGTPEGRRYFEPDVESLLVTSGRRDRASRSGI